MSVKQMIEEYPAEPTNVYNTEEWSENMWDAANVHPKGKPLTEGGAEVLDPVPLEPPLGYTRQEPLALQIRNQVILAKKLAEAEAEGDDSFEDADDFEVGDDYDPSSPYETDFDPMSDEDKAALASQGRDIDRSLSQEQKEKIMRATSAHSGMKSAKPTSSGQPKVATQSEDDATADE